MEVDDGDAHCKQGIWLTRFRRAVGSDLASFIIRDFEFVVRRIYILIEPILSNFYYLAEILLLATVYWLLTVHFLSSSEPQKGKPTNFIRALGWIHNLILLVLFGLWIGFMYTSIRYRVGVVKYDYDLKIADALMDLNLAFLVLYFCATIEIMAWAVIAFWKRKTEKRVGYFLMTAVTCHSATVPHSYQFLESGYFPLPHRHPSLRPLLHLYRHRRATPKRHRYRRCRLHRHLLLTTLHRPRLRRHSPYRAPT